MEKHIAIDTELRNKTLLDYPEKFTKQDSLIRHWQHWISQSLQEIAESVRLDFASFIRMKKITFDIEALFSEVDLSQVTNTETRLVDLHVTCISIEQEEQVCDILVEETSPSFDCNDHHLKETTPCPFDSFTELLDSIGKIVSVLKVFRHLYVKSAVYKEPRCDRQQTKSSLAEPKPEELIETGLYSLKFTAASKESLVYAAIRRRAGEFRALKKKHYCKTVIFGKLSLRQKELLMIGIKSNLSILQIAQTFARFTDWVVVGFYSRIPPPPIDSGHTSTLKINRSSEYSIGKKAEEEECKFALLTSYVKFVRLIAAKAKRKRALPKRDAPEKEANDDVYGIQRKSIFKVIRHVSELSTKTRAQLSKIHEEFVAIPELFELLYHGAYEKVNFILV